MIDYINIKITPGRFRPDSTMREIEIVVKTWFKEYCIRQLYPENWLDSDFDRLMDSMKERLRLHINDQKLKASGSNPGKEADGD